MKLTLNLLVHTDEVRADFYGTDAVTQKRSAALFLLKMKKSKRLSQVAIDDIVHEWNGIFDHTVQRLLAGVRAKMAASGVDFRGIEGLPEIFENVPHPFHGLQTRHMQETHAGEVLSRQSWTSGKYAR